MKEDSKQTKAWASLFGKEYTDRNKMTVEEVDLMYKRRYGVSRTEMNDKFLGNLDRKARILEVGSNIGLQLLFLQKMGFTNLYGIELSAYAVELSKSMTEGINIIQGSALDIPFKDGFFDLVFTSGVLIHINPVELSIAMGEIYRCANSFIWGFEYFSQEFAKVEYREADLLWKANYPEIYRGQFRNLSVVKVRLFKYLADENEDVMFLLKKGK